MVNQRHGRIVSISSFAAFNTVPYFNVYTATKCGVDGFMRCLEDEINLIKKFDFMKFTTVYPSFIKTRKDFSDSLALNGFMLSPEYVADETVKAIKFGQKRKIMISENRVLNFLLG